MIETSPADDFVAPDPELHRSIGLTDEEYGLIVGVLGRHPSPVELAMYSVMWSEHCSYKSSRIHLGRLPSEGPHVLVGPGENAGVIDVGDGIAVALRIESHNHPSAIEPYQGAATGVGGILRDVFTVGARPIALMDPLFFGPLEDDRSRWIFDGVVRGISGYGNSVGVPTVGGQLTFAPGYRGNPLVNVFCLGVLPVERLVLGQASGVGNLALLLGSLTGRDGIGGVSVLASAGFGGAEEAKRPSVQVGDPFEEKRLIEACLDLLDQGLVVGIQDLGGAGLACATSETAARAGLGMEVDVTAVPLREAGMSPVEIMTSESQERMLAIVEPQSLGQVLDTCHRHEVRATVIARVTEAGDDGTGMLVIREGAGPEDPVVGRVPARSLADDAPRYRRPLAAPGDWAERQRPGVWAAAAAAATPAAAAAASPAVATAVPPAVAEPATTSVAEPATTSVAAAVPPATTPGGRYGFECGLDLLAMLYDPTFVARQYDHQLFLNTVRGPGEADSTVLRLAAPGVPSIGKGLALTCDANPGWCAIDPRRGAALTVAEAVLNVSCVGARPVAAVDCLNFGNPEHPEVMWQLSEAIDGLAEGCRAFDVPIVGGNVSLYNESAGVDIDPTPVLGLIGLIDQLAGQPAGLDMAAGDSLVLVGPDPDPEALGGSRWCRELRGELVGALPALDVAVHEGVCRLARLLGDGGGPTAGIPAGVTGIHDVSDGGLAVCLAELCCAALVGVSVSGIGSAGELFSEAPSRFVVSTAEPAAVLALAGDHGVAAKVIGSVGGGRLTVEGLVDLDLDEVISVRSSRLPEAADRAAG